MTDDRTTDVGLYNYGLSFFKAAEALVSAKVRSTHAMSPIVFLYGHAVELFLKAFLRSQGLSVADIKSIGHRADTLADKCVGLGLHLDDEDVDVIERITEANTPINSRYIVTGPHTWPSPGGLHRTGVSLRSSVRTALKAAGHRVR